ncbi:19111_t:CDS:2, partial [Dentiscutata erythropus]
TELVKLIEQKSKQNLLNEHENEFRDKIVENELSNDFESIKFKGNDDVNIGCEIKDVKFIRFMDVKNNTKGYEKVNRWEIERNKLKKKRGLDTKLTLIILPDKESSDKAKKNNEDADLENLIDCLLGNLKNLNTQIKGN